MGLFFDDSPHLKCPKCGGDILTTRDIGCFTDCKDTIRFDKVATEIVCVNCGTRVRTVRDFDKQVVAAHP